MHLFFQILYVDSLMCPIVLFLKKRNEFTIKFDLSLLQFLLVSLLISYLLFSN